jgi:hypothetical protein
MVKKLLPLMMSGLLLATSSGCYTKNKTQETRPHQEAVVKTVENVESLVPERYHGNWKLSKTYFDEMSGKRNKDHNGPHMVVINGEDYAYYLSGNSFEEDKSFYRQSPLKINEVKNRSDGSGRFYTENLFRNPIIFEIHPEDNSLTFIAGDENRQRFDIENVEDVRYTKYVPLSSEALKLQDLVEGEWLLSRRYVFETTQKSGNEKLDQIISTDDQNLYLSKGEYNTTTQKMERERKEVWVIKSIHREKTGDGIEMKISNGHGIMDVIFKPGIKKIIYGDQEFGMLRYDATKLGEETLEDTINNHGHSHN